MIDSIKDEQTYNKDRYKRALPMQPDEFKQQIELTTEAILSKV